MQKYLPLYAPRRDPLGSTPHDSDAYSPESSRPTTPDPTPRSQPEPQLSPTPKPSFSQLTPMEKIDLILDTMDTFVYADYKFVKDIPKGEITFKRNWDMDQESITYDKSLYDAFNSLHSKELMGSPREAEQPVFDTRETDEGIMQGVVEFCKLVGVDVVCEEDSQQTGSECLQSHIDDAVSAFIDKRDWRLYEESYEQRENKDKYTAEKYYREHTSVEDAKRELDDDLSLTEISRIRIIEFMTEMIKKKTTKRIGGFEQRSYDEYYAFQASILKNPSNYMRLKSRICNRLINIYLNRSYGFGVDVIEFWTEAFESWVEVLRRFPKRGIDHDEILKNRLQEIKDYENELIRGVV